MSMIAAPVVSFLVMCKITSTAASQTYKVNNKLNWEEKYLIYPLACNHCRKQHVGELLKVSSIAEITTNMMTVTKTKNMKHENKKQLQTKHVCKNT